MFFHRLSNTGKNKQKEFLKTIIERKSGLKMNQTNKIREKSIRNNVLLPNVLLTIMKHWKK